MWEHEPETKEYNQIMTEDFNTKTVIPPIGSKICVDNVMYIVSEVIIDYTTNHNVNVYCYKSTNENSNVKQFFAEKFKKILNA